MKKIKIGFVGAGFNGQLIHIANYHRLNSCILSAIAEPRKKIRNLVAKRYGIKNQYDNHIDLIKNQKDLDAVIIVTKRQLLGPIALDFLKKNISILVEKPMAGNITQASRLIKSWNKNNTIYKLAYNKKFDKGILKAKYYLDKFLSDSSLGKIVLVKSHRSSGTGYANIKGDIKTEEKNNYSHKEWNSKPAWIPNKLKKQFENYLNLYCHNINLIRFFCGDILNVKHSNLSSKLMSVVMMNNGKYDIILETGFFDRNVWDETFEIYFEKGSIKIKLPPQHMKKETASFIISSPYLKKNITFKNNNKYDWSFYYQAKFFADTIKNNDLKNTFNSPEDALGDMKVIEKIWKKYLNL